MLRVLVVVCALSISGVTAAELVVYEGTGIVDTIETRSGLFPFSVGDEVRFRVQVDNATPASSISDPPTQQARYDNAIKDLDLWMNGVAVSLPSESEAFNYFHETNYVTVLNDDPPLERLQTGWQQTAIDGKLFIFLLIVEPPLSSYALPTEVDFSPSTSGGGNFSVFPYPGVEGDVARWRVTSFVIKPQPSVPDLLQQLLTDSTGVGPGKALANKVALAQTYYAVPDIQATCAVLQSYLEQVTTWKGKKLSAAQAEALSGDAEVIMSAIACE